MSKKNDLRLQTLQLGRANTQKDISENMSYMSEKIAHAGIESCHGQFERRKYENQKTLSPKNIKVLFGIMDRMEKFKINWFLVYR